MYPHPSLYLDPVNFAGSSATVSIGNDINNNNNHLGGMNPDAGVVTFQAQRAHEWPTDLDSVPSEAERLGHTHAPYYPADLHRLPAVRVTLNDSPPMTPPLRAGGRNRRLEDTPISELLNHAATTTSSPTTARPSPVTDLLLSSTDNASSTGDTPIVDLLAVAGVSGGGGSLRSIQSSSRRSSVHWEDGGTCGSKGVVTAVHDYSSHGNDDGSHNNVDYTISKPSAQTSGRGVTFRAQTSLIGRQNEGFSSDETSMRSMQG